MWNRVTYHGSQAAVNFQFLDSGSMQNINFYDDACTYLQVDGIVERCPNGPFIALRIASM